MGTLRKLGPILVALVVVAGASTSARAAPTLTRATIEFVGTILFDGHLSATGQERCWTTIETAATASPSVGVIVQGVRTIIEPIQFNLGGCGTESLGAGSGTVWDLTAASRCFCLVDLLCPPPPGPACGTYTRAGSQLSVVINNVFVTDGPSPIAQTTGPYNGLVFKGRVVDMRDSASGTVGEIAGVLSYK